MRYHLDTSFLIDWERDEPRIREIRAEIMAGVHDVTVDPIVETEFFASFRAGRRTQAIFSSILAVGARLEITSEASRLAATWLSPMDQRQRRARFADSVVAAIAYAESATLVTNDAGMPLFPVSVLLY